MCELSNPYPAIFQKFIQSNFHQIVIVSKFASKPFSVDDGHTKNIKHGAIGAKSRPAQLIKFKPPRHNLMSDFLSGNFKSSENLSSLDDLNANEYLSQLRSSIGVYDAKKLDDPDIKSLLNSIVKDPEFRRRIMLKYPDQVHKVIQAYFHNYSNDKEKIGELYETLANWDTTHMSIEVFLLLLTKEHYDLTIRQWALQNIDRKASGKFLDSKIIFVVC